MMEVSVFDYVVPTIKLSMQLAMNVATVEVSKCATLSKNCTATSYDYSYSSYIHIRSYNILIL